MKKIIATALFTTLLNSSWAQIPMPIHDPLTYRSVAVEKYSGIKGSPFVFETEMKGLVTTNKGSYEVENLKYNCYDNVLQYTKNDEPFEITDPVLFFQFYAKPGDAVPTINFERGFNGSGIKADQFARVLSNGKTKFIRLDTKSLTEMNEINAGVIKTFADVTKWYIVRGSSASLIKLNKAEITALLTDHADEVQQYISAQSLNLKKEDDCIKLINYYNSL